MCHSYRDRSTRTLVLVDGWVSSSTVKDHEGNREVLMDDMCKDTPQPSLSEPDK
jgi:hypothetical protein